MGLHLKDGTRVTKASIATTADPDPLVTIDTDLFERQPYSNFDQDPEGSQLTLYCRAGRQLRQSEIDLLFPAPSISVVSPSQGLIAGGTLVTITGTDLDAVTGVKFGGVAGTSVTVKTPRELTVVAPPHAAGAVSVEVTAPDGSDTENGAFTYA